MHALWLTFFRFPPSDVSFVFASHNDRVDFLERLRSMARYYSDDAVIVGRDGLSCEDYDHHQNVPATLVRSISADSLSMVHDSGVDEHVLRTRQADFMPLNAAFDDGEVYFRADNIKHVRELMDVSLSDNPDLDFRVYRESLGNRWNQESVVGYNYNSATRSAKNEIITVYSNSNLNVNCVCVIYLSMYLFLLESGG